MIAIYIISILFIPLAIYMLVKKPKKIIKNNKIEEDEENSYERERTVAINVSPAQLKLAIPEDEILVYGVIMDLSVEAGFITLASYITGASNLFFGSGKFIKGGGRNEIVANKSVELVTTAQEFLIYAKPIHIIIPPVQGALQFYFLTNKGKFLVNDKLSHIEDNSSQLLPLFEKGSFVIKEIHQQNLEMS